MQIYKYLLVTTPGPFGTTITLPESDNIKKLGSINNWEYITAEDPLKSEEFEFIDVIDIEEINSIPLLVSSKAEAKRLYNYITNNPCVIMPDNKIWKYDSNNENQRWKLEGNDDDIFANGVILIDISNAWEIKKSRLDQEYSDWNNGNCIELFQFSE